MWVDLFSHNVRPMLWIQICNVLVGWTHTRIQVGNEACAEKKIVNNFMFEVLNLMFDVLF
jgi:hypothetical protein